MGGVGKMGVFGETSSISGLVDMGSPIRPLAIGSVSSLALAMGELDGMNT